jgi:AraC-like DNA-binding protein
MAGVRTIDSIWAKRISERLRGAGLPIEEIIQKAGIKPYLLNQKSGRIPFRQHAELLDLAATALKNGCFGLELAAKEIDPRDGGLLVYAALSSKTFGEALSVLERYIHVLNEAADVRSDMTGDTAIIEFDFSEPKAKSLRQATEFGMANLIRSLRFLIGIQIRPAAVSFVHPRNREIAKFERFFGCPVQFAAKQNSLTFSRRQLALPIATADDRLLGILTGYCDEILADREQNSPGLQHQVERIVMRLLSRGEAETRNVAHELGMSVRTLARKLNESGATFTKILDRLRFDLAQKYLKDASLTPSQITFFLGYSEVSAFSHAFKRWTGTTPGEWRAKRVK